ncbi:PIN domain-containing protein [Frigoribacterium sp. UYMn621]|uniref:type II toxin-antitoxin system VapC family toxin n=1 Tax=Frigoribacterium sp. UYMn621 TaxID=3156343 RepID=UPI003392130B
MARVIVLDANVLIAFLDSSDPHHAVSTELLERHFVDGFASSVLTVAEALVHPTRVDRQDAAMTALLSIGVRVIPLEATDATELARVRNSYRLRMPDAVALHTAIRTGSELATFDDALVAAARRAGVSLAS